MCPAARTRPPLHLRNQRAPVAQLDRASDYGSEGWEFESLRARHDATRFHRIGVGGAWRSPVSAPGSGAEGRGFESRLAHLPAARRAKWGNGVRGCAASDPISVTPFLPGVS